MLVTAARVTDCEQHQGEVVSVQARQVLVEQPAVRTERGRERQDPAFPAGPRTAGGQLLGELVEVDPARPRSSTCTLRQSGLKLISNPVSCSRSTTRRLSDPIRGLAVSADHCCNRRTDASVLTGRGIAF